MKTNNKKKGVKTMDVILIIVGALLASFTIAMIIIFIKYGSIPDTLCACVFGALGGECGAMAWIRTSKDKNRDREIELEDRKYLEEKEKEAINGADRNNQRTEDLEFSEKQGTE